MRPHSYTFLDSSMTYILRRPHARCHGCSSTYKRVRKWQTAVRNSPSAEVEDNVKHKAHVHRILKVNPIPDIMSGYSPCNIQWNCKCAVKCEHEHDKFPRRSELPIRSYKPLAPIGFFFVLDRQFVAVRDETHRNEHRLLAQATESVRMRTK